MKRNKRATRFEMEINEGEDAETLIGRWEAEESDFPWLDEDRKPRHENNHDRKIRKDKIGKKTRADMAKSKFSPRRGGSVNMSMSNEEPTLKQARLSLMKMLPPIMRS